MSSRDPEKFVMLEREVSTARSPSKTSLEARAHIEGAARNALSQRLQLPLDGQGLWSSEWRQEKEEEL